MGAIIVLYFLLGSCNPGKPEPDLERKTELVYLDSLGVVRWTGTDEEIALFGVNYCISSACDYRAAGYAGSDRKAMIDQDLAHFKRMGFDGMRLCFWGDWQNTDREGNLVENDHLDLLDYLVSKASQQDIYMLFSPIVTYSSQWPDKMEDTSDLGFSFHYDKWDLGSDPGAIKAQVKYLKQILNHVNPYTGNAYRDEPNIIIIEPINEPSHHVDDIPGSIDYINTLYDAIRNAGCNKLVFYNVSQDFRMVPAIQNSKVEGSTHAWYPTQLMNGRKLRGNYLIYVERYDQMLDPGLKGKGKLVYEFDTPDVLDSYMYPAMVRTFRTGGIQFANQFAYDMLATSHANLGWQTHYLNMVYTPRKAVSAIIAARAMHELPRLKSYGFYPENNRFGDFRVSYKQNLSEYITDSVFLYSNNTINEPRNPNELEHIVGCGSSPVIDYEGEGIYFLDKFEDGIWKLEIYPDALITEDPFGQISPHKVVSRIIYREWPMKISLPDLGDDFTIQPLNNGNTFSSSADGGKFMIRPGIYLLRKKEKANTPLSDNHSTFSFVAPEPQNLPLQVVLDPVEEYLLGDTCKITARIIGPNPPVRVTCYVRNVGDWNFKAHEMLNERGYVYQTRILPGSLNPGLIEYCITVEENGLLQTFPGNIPGEPSNWGFVMDNLWESYIVHPNSPLVIFDALKNRNELNFTRIFKSIPYEIQYVTGSLPGNLALQIFIPDFTQKEGYQFPPDISFDHFIGDKIKGRGESIWNARSIQVKARSTEQAAGRILVSLIDSDGKAWGAEVPIISEWRTIEISLQDFRPVKAAILPQDWPGVNPYWYPSGNNTEPLKDLAALEKLQISLSDRLFPEISENTFGFEIENVYLGF